MDFILRPWRESDAESMARYANDPLIAKNLRDAFPHPYTVEDARQFIPVSYTHLRVKKACPIAAKIISEIPVSITFPISGTR